MPTTPSTPSTPSAPAAQSAADEKVSVFGRQVAYKWIVATVYVSALFLDILDTTIVNVALPKMGAELHSSKVEWVVLGYTLSLAVWIPTSGWLGDRVGTKRTFMFALCAFTLGSALCGMAQTLDQLIAFRVLQGIGGGMLTPVGMAMLFRAFPPAERARASSIIMVPTLFAPALGPVLGGLLTEYLNWRWIFYVNLPIAMVAIWFGFTFLREHREPTAGRLDVAGFLLSAGALALLVYALEQGSLAGWDSPEIAITAAIGLACAVAMVLVELRIPFPMIDLRLLNNRIFRQCNVVSLFSMAGFFGVTFVLPLYLQNVRGLDPLESGLATFPQAFGVMASAFVAGRIYAAVGPRRMMSVGLMLAAVTIVLLTRIEPDTSLWYIRTVIFLRGMCMGFAFLPMQAASYATIPPAQNGRASSLFSTQRQVSVSIGVAVMASILTAHMRLDGPVGSDAVGKAMDGVHLALWVAVGFNVLSSLAALFIRDDDARHTMVRRR